MPIMQTVIQGDGGNTPKVPLTVVNGVLSKGTTGIDVNGATSIGAYAFYYEYREISANCTGSAFINTQNLTTISGANALYQTFNSTALLCNFTSTGLDNVTTISGNSAMSGTFKNCAALTSTGLENLTSVSGTSALYSTFSGCTSLTSPGIDWDKVDCKTHGTGVSSGIYSSMFENCTGLTTTGFENKEILWSDIGRDYLFSYTFNGCTTLTSTGLNKLKYIPSAYMFSYTFKGCTGITDAGLGNLEMIGDASCCGYMYSGCIGLTVVRMPYFIGTRTISSTGCCKYMFQGCTGLTDVYFNSINGARFTGGTIASSFSNFLSGVSGCTVHLPSNQTSYFDAYTFGGTNTTVLFDLPAVYKITTSNSLILYQQDKYLTATSRCWAYLSSEQYCTYYYTSGTTMPSVGDSLYEDPECTIDTGETVSVIYV